MPICLATNAGTASITFQLLEHTNLTVLAGSFADVVHTRWNMVAPDGAQVHEEWWAKGVGRIKRLHISGSSSAVSYELIQYSLPGPHLIAARIAAPARYGCPEPAAAIPVPQWKPCSGARGRANAVERSTWCDRGSGEFSGPGTLAPYSDEHPQEWRDGF